MKVAADLRRALNEQAGFNALHRMRAHQKAKAIAKIRWTRWHPPQDPEGKGAWGIKCEYWVSGHFHASLELDKDGRHHLSVGHDEREPTLGEVRAARVELCPQAEWLFLGFHSSAVHGQTGAAVVNLVEFREDDGQQTEIWTPKR